MYEIKPEDALLLIEFREREPRDFSLDLRRLLNRLRLVPLAGREVILTVEPEAKWCIGRLGPRRGDRVERIDERVFASHKEAEFAVLVMRWKRLTHHPLPAGLERTP